MASREGNFSGAKLGHAEEAVRDGVQGLSAMTLLSALMT
jgi:hypothetical protein